MRLILGPFSLEVGDRCIDPAPITILHMEYFTLRFRDQLAEEHLPRRDRMNKWESNEINI